MSIKWGDLVTGKDGAGKKLTGLCLEHIVDDPEDGPIYLICVKTYGMKMHACVHVTGAELVPLNLRADAALQAAEERAEKAEAMLRRLEWPYRFMSGGSGCFICLRPPGKGHTPGCELAALLGEKETP